MRPWSALGLLLVVLTPGHVGARIKVDRYEPAPLPTVRLWVTLLDDRDRAVPIDRVEGFSVYADGRLLEEGDVRVAGDLGEPMAVAIVVDARFDESWRTARRALEGPLAKLPDDTRAFAIAQHEGFERFPKESWSREPASIPASLGEVTVGGSVDAPQLFRALQAALEEFPLKDGVEKEAEDKLPKLDADDVFPVDRLLVVVGDGRLETTPRVDVHERLRTLVRLARRRGVRVMGVGVVGDTDHLWALEVLSRKSGGTYRRALTEDSVTEHVAASFAEMGGRFALEVDVPGLRRGDLANFMVKVRLRAGATESSRDYTARIGNRLGFWAKIADFVSDVWERWPWWARALLIGGLLLIVALVVLVILVRRLKKRRKAARAVDAARAEALAARRPCPVCGQVMMPSWDECLFCAQARAGVKPMRFRLTGRSGVWEGQVHRFDKDLVTIGAARSCDIQVLDRGVQAEHCGVRDRGDEFLLTDFNTSVGTWLNGERVSQAQVGEGDVIRVGECEFVFGEEA